jgi:glycosyltransferase AglD
MKIKDKLSIVMVAYNEERHIERVIREYHSNVFTKAPAGSEFIVYLDGSADSTPSIVKSLSNSLMNLKVIDCKENKGYFGAVKTALSHAKNDLIFFSDSSGKHAAADFWNMLPKTDEYDIVTGLRSSRGDTRYRQILSFCQRLFVSCLFMMPLYDFNTGFKLIRKKVLDDLLKECSTLPVTFSTELVIRAHKKGYKIVNSPVCFKHRGGPEKQFAPQKLPKILSTQLIAYLKLRLELL